ncbi:hypothetical protein Poly21_22140 [Allorhodopirellula heiligendammensis]|uniref:Uncharacterized protein n=1 Tax=Allorhodopirellula heiligendammensis TaxID=2714739 RepID=A0A5C6C9I1_9BACT|nr:hypothetical protein Poly21_22140 [Allorhodopirellula heiligendammensis]
MGQGFSRFIRCHQRTGTGNCLYRGFKCSAHLASSNSLRVMVAMCRSAPLICHFETPLYRDSLASEGTPLFLVVAR